MSLKIGVVMDPIGDINLKKDSTMAMLLEAQSRGWALYYMEQADLYMAHDLAKAKMKPLKVFDNEKNWFQLEPAADLPLDSLDAILMRKDPPFDMNYI